MKVDLPPVMHMLSGWNSVTMNIVINGLNTVLFLAWSVTILETEKLAVKMHGLSIVVYYRVSGPCGEAILYLLVSRVMVFIMIMPAEIKI